MMSAVVAQDAQGTLLSVRVTVVTHDRSSEAHGSANCKGSSYVAKATRPVLRPGYAGLEEHSMMVLVDDDNAGSYNLAQSTRKAIRRLFTKRRMPPRGWKGKRNVVQSKLLNKFLVAVATALNVILAINDSTTTCQ